MASPKGGTSVEFHRGRLLDHIQLEVADVDRSRRFYEAVLTALGLAVTGEGEGYFFADELFVSAGGSAPLRVHLAFQAESPEAVKRFHAAGLAAGGRDNGPPGERDYHPGYYAAYLLDPDGNNIEAVYHGPAARSAPSVVITASG
jgi:catechol 2,3-dioxygenase-like lactoylglutathione lyase family enzyme